MNSRDYWDRRRTALEALVDRGCRLTASQVAQLYDGALERIQQRIRALYRRFAQGYPVTPAEVTGLLTAPQTREAREELLALWETCTDPQLRQELRAKLDAPAYAYRIGRLEALEDQIYFEAKSVGAGEAAYDRARLQDIYEESYYRTIFDQSQQVGQNVPFQTLEDRRASLAVEAYWSPSPEELGQNFSQRVWANTTRLAEEVREIVTQGLVTGGNYREMTQALEEHMGEVQWGKTLGPDGTTRAALTGRGAKYRAARLIRTEGNHISGQATIQAFQDAGIRRYLYRALLESKTCRVCGGLDGKDFPVSEQRPGVNMHPMHPQCRCFIAPYHDRAWLDRHTRSAQTGVGNWQPVPQSMTYQEWYRTYVQGKDLEQEQRRQRAKQADQTQWERYKAVLGEGAPGSLAEFQRMKYTDGDRWKVLTTAYRDKKLQERIRAGDYNLTINPEKQARHLLDSDGYIPGRSYLNISKDDPDAVQALISRYAGTGEILRNAQGQWNNRELIQADSPIGFDIDRKSGEETETDKAIIHYSKTGTHVVPTLRKFRKG